MVDIILIQQLRNVLVIITLNKIFETPAKKNPVSIPNSHMVELKCPMACSTSSIHCILQC